MDCPTNKCCTKCKIVKDIGQFYRKGEQHYGRCKACESDKNKKYRMENAKKVADSKQRRYKELGEEIRERGRRYYATHRKERCAYERRNRRRSNERDKQRYHTDLQVRLKECIYSRIRGTTKGQKTERTIELLGCSPLVYRLYLEAQFIEGMSWDNYGLWHIDHIIPISAFDLSDPAERREAFDYLNTQPLWANDNLRKSARTPKGFYL